MLLSKTIRFIGLIGLMTMTLGAYAQQGRIQYFRPYDQRGINIFETSKYDTVKFDGLKLRIGANFSQQYQSLKHSNSENMVGEVNKNALYDLSPGFNLAMANFNIDVQLTDGVRVSLISYMSSRHHNEFWVKGGFFQIDKVAFLNSQLMNDIWKNLTLKIGHMEINYGDSHFRRTDGGNALYNPFVENNLMDAFTTEIGGELYWQKSGFLAMVGITDGEIQGSTTKGDDRAPSYYGKAGYDGTFNDFRVRLTSSIYTTKSSISNTLYGGDRAGSRYYFVLEPTTATLTANSFSGRINPGFRDNITAFVINPFLKFKNIEVFGTYEIATGNSQVENGEIQSTDPAQGSFQKLSKRQANQYAIDGVYRFAKDKMYVGAKYNVLDGDLAFGQSTTQPNINQGVRQDVRVERTAFAAGWFITKNILLKGEYVTQKYKDFPATDIRNNGKFEGFVIEGVIGF
ncbi:MAG TPA: hypothetical protein VE467_18865 [Chryseolinea sp.]|jgi:hypothetical protein|nr:hypothetical protein [Chryseolinea sp.]